MARENKIWFRKSTGWWMVNVGGKQTKLTKGKAAKKEAEQKFHDLMSTSSRIPEAPNARVADMVEAFLRWSRLHLAYDTHRIHKYYCQLFSEACGQTAVRDLAPFHITRWVDAKVATGDWGETTVYNAKRTAFRVFSWASKEGIIPRNPLAGMPRPQPAPRGRAMMPNEFHKLLEAAYGCFKDFLIAMQQTGARPKEIRDMKWEHVKEDRIVWEKHKTRKKTGKARTIFLTPTMKALLDERRKLGQEYCFTNTRGKQWTMNAVRLQVVRIRERAGLSEDLCSYLIRHMFGTQAIINGLDVATVAEAMGHTSLEMISKVYLHLADEHSHMQKAMEQATILPTPAVASPGPVL